MTVYPCVKINLGLNVLRKREDGYHDLETLFVPSGEYHDVLEIISGDDYSTTSAHLFSTYGPSACGSCAGLSMSVPSALVQAISPDGKLMIPVKSLEGVEIMSANLLLENETDPIIWRGPVIAGAVKQFWSETLWQDIDYMFVDMPPGTGDVPLTVFQSLPVDGIIIVTSPQELVGMIVTKAVNMAKKMDIPILGVVENMSYLECPDCGKHIAVFGESHIDEEAAAQNIPVLAKIPIQPSIAQNVDGGRVEYMEMPWFEGAVKAVEDL